MGFLQLCLPVLCIRIFFLESDVHFFSRENYCVCIVLYWRGNMMFVDLFMRCVLFSNTSHTDSRGGCKQTYMQVGVCICMHETPVCMQVFSILHLRSGLCTLLFVCVHYYFMFVCLYVCMCPWWCYECHQCLNKCTKESLTQKRRYLNTIYLHCNSSHIQA